LLINYKLISAEKFDPKKDGTKDLLMLDIFATAVNVNYAEAALISAGPVKAVSSQRGGLKFAADENCLHGER
jgi:hypothetical protein